MDRVAEARRERAIDIAVAAGLTAVSVLLALGLVEGPVRRAAAVVLGIVHCGALAYRRSRPLAVVAVMALTAVATLPAGVPVVVLGPAVAVAVYTLGARTDPVTAKRVLAGVLVVMTVVVFGNGADVGTVLSNSVVLVLAWWLGDRSRRVAADVEETARRAVLDERLRIARELHDVVAHAMSVIAVQAGTGRFVLPESPDVAAQALATIETASRDALQELRRLLTVLRNADADAELLVPSPGLRELDDLVAATAASGVAVDVVVEGEPVPLPAGVDLCAYRVVQEALTNVRKHARARRAVVTVSYDDGEVSVDVSDDGVGAAARPTGGHGVLGMRERVALYGGSVEVGPAGRGFRVVARIPVGRTA